jgi:hypothetical protein
MEPEGHEGIGQAEWQQAWGRFMGSLDIVKSNDQGRITVVGVTIAGIRGGRDRSGSRGSRRKQEYRLLIDVSHLRARMPEVWVVSPSDERIRHANIYYARHCPIIQKPLPQLCWGTFPEEWRIGSASRRRLLTLLEYVQQHLNNQNLESPAR